MFNFGLEMMYANIDEALPEAQIRALRKGFLGESEYSMLKQVSTIQEFRIVMEDTDYGSDIFQNQSDGEQFDVQLLGRAMKERLMDEIQYMIAQSSYPLNQFLTMILHRYQIDNVVLIIEGLKPRPDGRPNLSIEELMRMAEPLGKFAELKNVQPVDGEDYASLYQ
jgi:V-type H+-transporting ATPase subunit d